jgi:hypothetical protein
MYPSMSGDRIPVGSTVIVQAQKGKCFQQICDVIDNKIELKYVILMPQLSFILSFQMLATCFGQNMPSSG